MIWKEALQHAVEQRCAETAENTTHRAEALQTILDAYGDGNVSEEDYQNLIVMLISICTGANLAEVLDWRNVLDPLPKQEDTFELVMAADPLYSSEHPKLSRFWDAQ
jgi:hypothetical protein